MADDRALFRTADAQQGRAYAPAEVALEPPAALGNAYREAVISGDCSLIFTLLSEHPDAISGVVDMLRSDRDSAQAARLDLFKKLVEEGAHP